MSDPFLPLSFWEQGTTDNSVPSNDNALKFMITQSDVNKSTTAQPGSPSDGDTYIIQSTHTGSQWATFDPDDLAIFYGGTWYAYAPTEGVSVTVGDEIWVYDSGAWTQAAGGGGGSTAWGDLTGVPAPINDLAALTDPGADRILFWDDSAGIYTHLTVGTNLTITGTTLDASGGGGGSPAGSDKQIQYNNSGSFGAEAGFEYDASTNTLTVPKINEGKGTDISSATTTDIGAATGNFVHVTGTTTITGFGTVAAGARRLVVFDGALTLTHNATSLILPSGANITTAAGDALIAVSEGSGNWRVTHYQKKDGTALVGGGGGLSNWTEGLSTSSPNATINVASFTPSGGTNRDVAYVPKGTGSVLAAVPDSSTAGGNKRGTNSVDLQTKRSAAAQVASGQDSVVSGGNGNTASGSNSVVTGGGNNTASGSNSQAGGSSSTASGTFSFAYGSSAAASMQGSVAIGESVTANANYASARGAYATARGVIGAEVYGSHTTSQGRHQRGTYVGGVTTSNATPTLITADGGAGTSANQIYISNSYSAYTLKILVVARKQGGTADSKHWEITAAAYRDSAANTVAIIGTPTVTVIAASAGASSWTVDLLADTTVGAIGVRATGQAATSIRWSHVTYTTEVEYAP